VKNTENPMKKCERNFDRKQKLLVWEFQQQPVFYENKCAIALVDFN